MRLSTIIVFVIYTICYSCAYKSQSQVYTNEDILMRLLIQPRDNYGCDVIVPSCGPKGKCCDQHDACFKKHGCRGNSWGWSWIPGAAIFDPCARCNKAVFFCVTNLFVWPGPSECCRDGNCGQHRPRKHSAKIHHRYSTQKQTENESN